jgi:hypothetical protein
VLTALLSPRTSFADSLECEPGERLDVVLYDWKLRGFLSIVAGMRFPTSGSGTLVTAYRRGGEIAETELRINADSAKGDRYRYRSVIDLKNNRSVESIDGYQFSGRTKSDTTTFDYENGKARRVRIDTKKGSGETIRYDTFPGSNVKDVLTSIHHIRQSSSEMKEPERHGVFAGGKVYEVLITPGTTRKFSFDGRQVEGRLFTITATPENRDKWPGDVKVWITTDRDRLPVEIDLGRSMASLKLQAVSRFSCP